MKFNIASYVKGLFPGIKTADIHDQLDGIRRADRDSVRPALELAAKKLKGRKFQSDFVKRFSKDLGVASGLRGDWIEQLVELEKLTIAKVEILFELLDKNFEDRVQKSSVTFRQANILRVIELLSFWQSYAVAIVPMLITDEISQTDGTQRLSEVYAPGEIKRMESQANDFMSACKLIAQRADAFRTGLEELPAAVVTPESEELLRAAQGRGKMDPLSLGFLTQGTSPIFAVLKWWGERQVLRLQKAELEAKDIERRIIQLERINDGTSEQLQRQIDYDRDRLKDLTAKIAKMEAAL